jgi:hypothetical protein
MAMWRAKFPMWALMGFALLVGCSRGPRFNPVKGRVLWHGEPAAGARLIFHPLAETPGVPKPSALVDENGYFHVGTYAPNDGAPAGEYIVTIDWFDLASQTASADVGETPMSTDKLKGRYADPKRSSLHVTIKQGENTLPPFELK